MSGMELNYLNFDVSEDDNGAASWDAMASTLPVRLPEALREASAVLQWAHSAFGTPEGNDEGLAQWDFDLQLAQEVAGGATRDLNARFDAAAGRIETIPALSDAGYCVLTLTLSGPAAFAAAFSDRFGLASLGE